MSDFDPYHKWLGIPETERPITKYRLLGIGEFESDREVISAAAERQTIYLRTLQAGEHEVLVAQLLNEVSQARITLLNADQKAEYDEELRKQQTPEPVPEPTPSPVVVRGTENEKKLITLMLNGLAWDLQEDYFAIIPEYVKGVDPEENPEQYEKFMAIFDRSPSHFRDYLINDLATVLQDRVDAVIKEL
jgi:hypothetical protein